MARTRLLHPDFFFDDILGSLPIEDSLTFPGLWVFADRDGYLDDNPRKLKALIFPYRDVDINASLQRLHDAGLIIRYSKSPDLEESLPQKQYIKIKNFLKYQHPHAREIASIIPPYFEELEVQARPRHVQGTTLVSTRHDLGDDEPGVSVSVSNSVKRHVTSKKPEVEQVPEPPQLQLIPPKPKPDVVQELFDHWKAAFRKNSRTLLDANRRRLLERALSPTGLRATPQEVKAAIDGCAKSPWHMGSNPSGKKYSELGLILRNREKLESFIEASQSDPNSITAKLEAFARDLNATQ